MSETYVRPDVAAMLALGAERPRPAMRALGPTATREAMRALGKMVDLPIGELAVARDIAVPGPDGRDVPTRLFDARPTRADGPIVLFFHGGGFVFGDLDSHASLCAEIARQLDLPVLAVDYRLAPEHPWPAASDDSLAVARWLNTAPTQLGFSPTGLVLVGDSAGGWLAVVVALVLLEQDATIRGIALGLIYPLIDMDCARYPSFAERGQGYTLNADSMNWFVECFAPDPAHRHYALSRLVRADLPPTVTISAGLDPLRDQGRAFAAALAEAGGISLHLEAAGQVHGFAGSRAALPSARDDVGDFLTLLDAALKLARARSADERG